MITFVKGNQLVGDVEFVLCPYCDDYIDANMQILFSEHLIKHSETLRL